MYGSMRILVVGYAALLWGGVVVGYRLTKLDGSGSHATESLVGLGLGVVLLLVGGWLVVRRARRG
jgi:hypothetical protein